MLDDGSSAVNMLVACRVVIFLRRRRQVQATQACSHARKPPLCVSLEWQAACQLCFLSRRETSGMFNILFSILYLIFYICCAVHCSREYLSPCLCAVLALPAKGYSPGVHGNYAIVAALLLVRFMSCTKQHCNFTMLQRCNTTAMTWQTSPPLGLPSQGRLRQRGPCALKR